VLLPFIDVGINCLRHCLIGLALKCGPDTVKSGLEKEGAILFVDAPFQDI
jgi:hypothetical protein